MKVLGMYLLLKGKDVIMGIFMNLLYNARRHLVKNFFFTFLEL